MGQISQHWTLFERIKWMLFGESPNRDFMQAEIDRLRREWIDRNLQMIKDAAMQEVRLQQIQFLEHEIER